MRKYRSCLDGVAKGANRHDFRCGCCATAVARAGRRGRSGRDRLQRLERETQRNIELMWLTGRLMPDFKTTLCRPSRSAHERAGSARKRSLAEGAVRPEAPLLAAVNQTGPVPVREASTVGASPPAACGAAACCRCCCRSPRRLRRWANPSPCASLAGRLRPVVDPYQATGSETGPRIETLAGKLSFAFWVNRSDGRRRLTSSSTMRASSRANGAPRQLCTPTPNERCSRAFGRRISKRSGSGKTAGSRLAEPIKSSSFASFGNRASPISTGSFVL